MYSWEDLWYSYIKTICRRLLYDWYIEANLACEQALRGALAEGREKEGELATTSLEFEYLHQKSRCENAKFLLAEMTLVMTSLPWHVISNVCLNSRSFPLRADWRKSDSSVDGEPQGNWRWNSNSGDVVASSPSFSRPAARASRRACSQAKANRNNANHLTRVLFLSHFCIYDSKQIQCPFRYWMCFSIDWLPQFDSLVNFSDNRVKSVCFLWGTKELNFQINVMQHKNVTKLWFYGILDQRWGWFTDHLKTCGWRDEQRRR